MSALHELAAFLVSYCDIRAETTGPGGHGAVSLILSADVVPDDTARHVMLWGFADQIGAIRAVGFDPAWQPAAAS